VELYLRTANFEVFNPKIEEIRLIRGRRKKLVVPLFPCYIFAKFSPRNFDLIIYTRGVRKILGINGRPTPIRESIIETIKHRVQNNGHILIPENPDTEFELNQGDYVFITDGPLKGFYGIVEYEKPDNRVIILLISLDYQVKVDIYKFLLKKVNPEDIF
jgi:transcriptional antiterminator RfaH